MGRGARGHSVGLSRLFMQCIWIMVLVSASWNIRPQAGFNPGISPSSSQCSITHACISRGCEIYRLDILHHDYTMKQYVCYLDRESRLRCMIAKASRKAAETVHPHITSHHIAVFVRSSGSNMVLGPRNSIDAYV